MMDEETELRESDTEQMLEQVLSDPSISQFLIRSQSDGMDTVCFYQRCQLHSQQQRIILHVSFYPPFNQVPEVQVSILDSVTGRVRITDQQKFGTRVEIVLNQPADEGSGQQAVLVECVATAPAGD